MSTTFVGICSIDLYSQCPRLPQLGETLKGHELNKGFGGKASNACAQFAFLATPEEKPSLLTAVGKDSDGESILNHFEKINIKKDSVIINEKQPTGLAICFVFDNGESAIVIHPCSLTKEMIHQHAETIKKSKIVVTNFEIPVDVAAETLKIAHEAGATTILTVAPATSCDKEIFRNSTIVIANQIEMEALKTTVDELHSLGVEAVIETLGGDGANVYEKGKQKVHVSATPVKAIDTTGAGDSFLGSFSYFLSKGQSYEEAAQKACKIASLSVQKIGTQSSYAHRGDPEIASLF